MKKETDELQRIDQSVDAFAEKIKQQMHDKYKKGFRGWDHESIDSLARQKLLNKAALVYTGSDTDVIDIGAFAMMIYKHLIDPNKTGSNK